MKILCDEHVPPAVVNALQSEGFDVRTVSEQLHAGTTDTDVLAYASQRGYLVLTNDSDFLDRDEGGILYYDDQAVSHNELVRAIRVVADLLADRDLTDRTIYLPDDWV